MKYLRVDFERAIVFTSSPWKTFATIEATDKLRIEDDGPLHIRITEGDATVRVPWARVISARPAPAAAPEAVVPALDPVINEATISTATHAAADIIGAADSGTLSMPTVVPNTSKGKGPRKGQVLR